MTRRYCGFDVHKNTIMAAAVDAEQNIVMKHAKYPLTILSSGQLRICTAAMRPLLRP